MKQNILETYKRRERRKNGKVKGNIMLGTMLTVVTFIALMFAVDIEPTMGEASYVEGIDVSTAEQGNQVIDWTKVYNSGRRFAFVKATEGQDWTDPNFITRMNGGRNAGLSMGAYHFGRPDTNSEDPEDAVKEANHFVTVAIDYLNYGIPPVLDLETGESLGWVFLSNWALKWMQKVTSLTGKVPVIYLNNNYASSLNGLTQYALWIAWLNPPPPQTGNWASWAYWQYNWHGSVDGISGEVNLDRRGSVGGVIIPADKTGLLAPYFGLASTIFAVAVVAAICVKRIEQNAMKQNIHEERKGREAQHGTQPC